MGQQNVQAKEVYCSVTPIFYYLIAISISRFIILQSFKKNLYCRYRATLNYRKIKVARNLQYRFFFKLCKNINLDMLIILQFDNQKTLVTELILELQAHKAKINGVFKRL